jgi:hypothetical protein
MIGIGVSDRPRPPKACHGHWSVKLGGSVWSGEPASDPIPTIDDLLNGKQHVARAKLRETAQDVN